MTPSPIARTQLILFHRYVRWYLRRNFHGLHLLRIADLEPLRGMPLLVCLNHPSWWDPLIALYLSRSFFPERLHYAPMAAVGLSKYKFFGKLGFFSAEPRQFLEIGDAVLSRTDAALWVTPQGEFSDVRQHPVRLANGVGHLARRNPGCVMLPIALEYAFWNERTPEAFACIGEPLIVDRAGAARDWTSRFGDAMARTQDLLSQKVQSRDPKSFEPLLSGAAGVGGVYDLYRAARARLSGKHFDAEHGRI